MGPAEGLKHDSSVLCDGLMSIPKASLSDYVGSLSRAKLVDLEQALKIALVLDGG